MVNPYLELNRVMTQKRLANDRLMALSDRERERGEAGEDCEASTCSLSSNYFKELEMELEHNVVTFGKWFFFCQHCRHGGHANCIDMWFGGSGDVFSPCLPVGKEGSRPSRSVCGVNGCDCNCVARL
jgi:hypothetical protein